MIEFEAWPKIARLNRDIVITEKIDGTNAAVVIEEHPFGTHVDGEIPGNVKFVLGPNVNEDGLPKYEYLVGAQSRKRLINPKADNHGFAAWVWENAEALARVLGPGLHFGEWWGSGIQRGYGFKEGQRYFSLFNTTRWDAAYDEEKWPAGLSIVPILYEGPFSESKVKAAVRMLDIFGSMAHHGYYHAEGVVIFHKAANMMFKVTLENDEAPKGKYEAVTSRGDAVSYAGRAA